MKKTTIFLNVWGTIVILAIVLVLVATIFRVINGEILHTVVAIALASFVSAMICFWVWIATYIVRAAFGNKKPYVNE